jgi:hypothetical protein
MGTSALIGAIRRRPALREHDTMIRKPVDIAAPRTQQHGAGRSGDRARDQRRARARLLTLAVADPGDQPAGTVTRYMVGFAARSVSAGHIRPGRHLRPSAPARTTRTPLTAEHITGEAAWYLDAQRASTHDRTRPRYMHPPDWLATGQLAARQGPPRYSSELRPAHQPRGDSPSPPPPIKGPLRDQHRPIGVRQMRLADHGPGLRRRRATIG